MDTYQGEFKEQIPRLKGYCPLRPARHRERGLGRGLLPAERAAAFITGTELRIDGGAPLGNRSMELAQDGPLAAVQRLPSRPTPKVLGG